MSTDNLASRALDITRPLVPALAEHAEEHDREASFPFESFDLLKQAGYHTLTVPTEFGGMGARLYELCLGQEDLARGDGSTALGIGMHLSLLGRLPEEGNWPRQLWERVCKDVVQRGTLINSAATEPAMGSPSRGGLPVTKARKVDGGWELSGRKSFVTLAPALDYFIVLATLEAEQKRGSFVVERSAPGVSVEPNWDVLGMRSTRSDDLVLESVFVPDEMYVPAFSQRSARGGRAWAALTIGATYLGIAVAARDTAAELLKARKPTGLGKPVSELEYIQEGLGRMDLSIRAARHLLHDTARRYDEAPAERADLTPAIASAKYLTTNAAIEVTDLAMRLAGGSALSQHLPLERLFRDARAGLYNPPSDHETLVLLGRWVLGERPELR